MSSIESSEISLKRESSTDDELAKEMGTAQVGQVKDESPSSDLKDLEHNQASNSDNALPLTLDSRHEPMDVPKIKNEASSTNGHISPKKESHRSKASRSTSQKVPPRVAPSLTELPDSTAEANSAYTVIDACTYQNKFLGYTEHAMECDCTEEWDSATKTNYACGEDSDCINRATKMECVGDCVCGTACQNQRFGRRVYADVSVIKTEKKGYGLRTNVDLKHGDFIFEYIGEVIAEGAFRRRMLQYDEEGIKHFYFMSLSKGEFVDATRKGNLGRFCNHSCNPNCYVDKWVVGDKLRMGIFAERRIKAGEELVFNYNVDRYGANPQPCYCGETNCTGFIGGKTQTERATKLSAATIEALGIEDDFDSWDTVVAKKPRKKKTSEDDEEYVDSIEAKRLDANGVTKVMAALMQCKEKWIAVRLLQRIQTSDDEDVRHRIVKLHGYQIMNSQLSAWRDDENVILQILDILDKFPRLTRNKIVDAKIDKTLEPLTKHEDDRVATKAQALLDVWSQLELAYRIPRKVRDTDGIKQDGIKFERRESAQQRRRSRSRSRSRSKTPPRGPGGSVPSGPRSQQRPALSAYRRAPLPLPKGWSQAKDENTGRVYFYTSSGKTQWVRPTQPAEQPPPPSLLPKQPSQQEVLKSIIDDIVASKDKDKEKEVKAAVPEKPETSKKEKKAEKWRSYDEEKQKKLYENTLFPYISHVMSKYKHKIPKNDLKRFGKEIAKKLVNSDFKAGRVKDPTKIDEKQQKKVKVFCKEYFDKAVQKHQKHEAERAARKAQKGTPKSKAATSTNVTPGQSPAVGVLMTPIKTEMEEEEDDDDEEMKISDNEIASDHESAGDTSPSHVGNEGNLKRKRFKGDAEDIKDEDDSDFLQSPAKKPNLDSEITSPMPPPPPPPAPPEDSPPEQGSPAPDIKMDDDMETDLHADTNFKGKSMADVLAQAQIEGDGDHEDDDAGMSMEDPAIKDEADSSKIDTDVKMDNPLIEGQPVAERVKNKDDRQYKEEDEVEWA